MTTTDKYVIYGLYCLCHPADGIRYVGQTSQGLNARLTNHLATVRNRIKTGKRLNWVGNWVQKHGYENIAGAVLEVCLPEELNSAEERWIACLDGLTNIRPGGSQSRGWKMPEDSLRFGERNPMYGKKRPQYVIEALQRGRKPISDETRKKLSRARTGKKMSDAARANMSRAQKIAKNTPEYKKAASERMKGSRNPRYGTHQSLETTRKIMASNPNIVLTEEIVRSIRARVAEGERMKDVASDLGVDPSTISHVVARRKWGWVE